MKTNECDLVVAYRSECSLEYDGITRYSDRV